MFKNIIFLILLFTLPLFGQNVMINNIDQEINSLIFNGNWQKSDSLIDVKLKSEPNSPKYNFLKAYNYFYARFIGNNNPFDRDQTIRQVKKYSWEAISQGEDLDESLENNFYLGSAYAFLARVNVMEQNIWDAFWNASKAENYFEDVIDEDQDFGDAYLNLGVIKYFPTIGITGFQSVLAWLGGMSGNREKGIEYITKSAQDGALFKSEAEYVLGLIYNFRENRFSLANDYWKSLSDQYPENNFFQTQYSRSYLTKLVEERGVQFLKDEFENLDSLYGVTNSNVLNTLGYSLMNQNKLDEALIVFQLNIKKFPNVANNYDSIAECYLNRGDNENAMKFYKIAFEKLQSDSTVTDEFREFLEENIRNQLRELNEDLDV